MSLRYPPSQRALAVVPLRRVSNTKTGLSPSTTRPRTFDHGLASAVEAGPVPRPAAALS